MTLRGRAVKCCYVRDRIHIRRADEEGSPADWYSQHMLSNVPEGCEETFHHKTSNDFEKLQCRRWILPTGGSGSQSHRAENFTGTGAENGFSDPQLVRECVGPG